MISTTATGVLLTLIYTVFCAGIGIAAFWTGLRRGLSLSQPNSGTQPGSPISAFDRVGPLVFRKTTKKKPLVRDDAEAWRKEQAENR